MWSRPLLANICDTARGTWLSRREGEPSSERSNKIESRARFHKLSLLDLDVERNRISSFLRDEEYHQSLLFQTSLGTSSDMRRCDMTQVQPLMTGHCSNPVPQPTPETLESNL